MLIPVFLSCLQIKKRRREKAKISELKPPDKKKKTPLGVFFFLVPRGTQSLCKGLVCALMKRERKP